METSWLGVQNRDKGVAVDGLLLGYGEGWGLSLGIANRSHDFE